MGRPTHDWGVRDSLLKEETLKRSPLERKKELAGRLPGDGRKVLAYKSSVKKVNGRGAWAAQSVERPTRGFS